MLRGRNISTVCWIATAAAPAAVLVAGRLCHEVVPHTRIPGAFQCLPHPGVRGWLPRADRAAMLKKERLIRLLTVPDFYAAAVEISCRCDLQSHVTPLQSQSMHLAVTINS
eukprot:SAG31_NODE_2289_length_6000_cov_3.020336_2_plen_111_part_00